MSELSGLGFPLSWSAFGHLVRAKGSDKIKSNVVSIVMTAYEERSMNRDFGTSVMLTQFRNPTTTDITLLKYVVTEAVNLHEPRVSVRDVSVSYADSVVTVKVSYAIRSSGAFDDAVVEV